MPIAKLGVSKKGNYGGLLLTGLVVVVLMTLNIIPGAIKFNPGSLAARNMELVAGVTTPSSLFPAAGVTTIAIFGLIGLAVLMFRKTQL